MLILSSGSRHGQRGFTLIEAMIAITLFAVAIALAIPYVGEGVQNSKIRAASESILSGLQTARAEAVRRNADVQFEFSAAPGIDWILRLRQAGVVSQLQVSSGEGSPTITAISNNRAATAAFDGLGRLRTDFNGRKSFSQLNIDTTALRPTDSRDLRILIDDGGEIRMCDPNILAAGDPRRCTL